MYATVRTREDRVDRQLAVGVREDRVTHRTRGRDPRGRAHVVEQRLELVHSGEVDSECIVAPVVVGEWIDDAKIGS